MKIKGPIVTLGAVAAVGAGIFLVNVNQQPEAAPQPAAAVVAPAQSVAPVKPPPPTAPPAVPFGPKEDFVADIPTKNGNLGLEIRVKGDEAWAYACDNKGIETWLSGSSRGGVLKLASADETAELTGRHEGNTAVGNLRIGEKRWDFTATPGETSVF